MDYYNYPNTEQIIDQPPPQDPYATSFNQGGRVFNMRYEEENFLKTIYNFQAQLDDFKHRWTGDTKNKDNEWTQNTKEERRIMNDKGVGWCISVLETFTSNNYIVTSFERQEINNIMLPLGKNINYELSKRWKEFGFKDKLDIQNVLFQMVDFIYSILKGTFNDGQRSLFSRTNNYSESVHRDMSAQNSSVFSRASRKIQV